jgi:hypothetical protein
MCLLPFPPPSDAPIDPPGVASQILFCVLFVYLWFETILVFLPERLRQRISVWQFGPSWAAKRGERP